MARLATNGPPDQLPYGQVAVCPSLAVVGLRTLLTCLLGHEACYDKHDGVFKLSMLLLRQ